MMEGILLVIFIIFLSDLGDTVSQLTLKMSINSINLNVDSFKKVVKLVFEIAKRPLAWVSLLFSIISLMLWLVALTKSDLNLAFSLDSMRYILIALASMIFLKEKVSLMRWMGIFTIIGGIAIVAIS